MTSLLIVKQWPDVDLIAAKKCGSTTVAYMRPEIPFIEVMANEYVVKKPIILVLRDPLWRLRATARRVTRPSVVMRHCLPYLHFFEGVDFEYIPFEQLSSYFPDRYGVEFGSVYPPVPEDYPVQAEDLKDEVLQLERLLECHKQLPIQDISKW